MGIASLRLFLAVAALVLLLAGLVSSLVYSSAFRDALADDRRAGLVRLLEAGGRLRGQLDVYRALVNTLADDPVLATVFEPARQLPDGAQDAAQAAALAALIQKSLTYGAWDVDLVDRSGRIFLSSSPQRVGARLLPALRSAALNGRLGTAVDVSKTDATGAKRLVRFSRWIKSVGSSPRGLVVVSANLAALEFEWPVTPEPVVFFDLEGRSISSNRPELVLLDGARVTRALNAVAEDAAAVDPPPAAASSAPADRLPLEQTSTVSGQPLWLYQRSAGGGAAGGVDPLEVQVLMRDFAPLGMVGAVVLDTANARDSARLRLGFALALMAALALAGLIVFQQQRRLAEKARQSATLEERVSARTAQLRAAQDELLEASNLAALGRLSAGVSHELNQPLAAILNYADNGRRLIDRARVDEVRGNLVEIGEQTRRITRIISNLRAFARQEATPTEIVQFDECVRRALALSANDLQKAGVTLVQTTAEEAYPVMAGAIRLEQVVLNLISNAIDAMQGQRKRILSVELHVEGEAARLRLRDTGTGIEEPDRVFEPFYTTKELGASKGLGMGLALSFGLVARFNGTLACDNWKKGAQFTMTLPLAREPVATALKPGGETLAPREVLHP